MEGISKERVVALFKKFYDDDIERVDQLEEAITSECKELHPIPEYKDLPQSAFTQEGTVINISDGDNRGKWVSTKEGWIPLK